MKIGIVCYPTVGGSGIVATELGHELAKRGHEIHFITYDVPFRLDTTQPNIHFHQVKIPDYPLFKYPDYALTLAVKIAEVAKTHSLDLVHVHYAIPHATSAYLAKQLTPLKVVTTLHGTDITLIGQDPSYTEIVNFSIDQSDVVTAVSHFLAQATQTKKEIVVIPNFVIAEPTTQKKMADVPVLLHSSNFRPVKRIEDVIAIFRLVRKEMPVKLALLGPALQNLAEEDVILLGEQRDVAPYYAGADLFLLPSEHESFGLAALEAMAYGTPVIGSNAGGLPELVGDTGMLHPVGDVQAMANSAIELLRNPQKHRELGEAAKARAANQYSPDRVIPLYEAAYGLIFDQK